MTAFLTGIGIGLALIGAALAWLWRSERRWQQAVHG